MSPKESEKRNEKHKAMHSKLKPLQKLLENPQLKKIIDMHLGHAGLEAVFRFGDFYFCIFKTEKQYILLFFQRFGGHKPESQYWSYTILDCIHETFDKIKEIFHRVYLKDYYADYVNPYLDPVPAWIILKPQYLGEEAKQYILDRLTELARIPGITKKLKKKGKPFKVFWWSYIHYSQ